jgi:hypothetical protein
MYKMQWRFSDYWSVKQRKAKTILMRGRLTLLIVVRHSAEAISMSINVTPTIISSCTLSISASTILARL